MLVIVPGEQCHLSCLPCGPSAHNELASLESVCKEVDLGEVAWFTLIHPVEPTNAIGAYDTLSDGESGDA